MKKYPPCAVCNSEDEEHTGNCHYGWHMPGCKLREKVDKARLEQDHFLAERLRAFIAEHRKVCPIMQDALNKLHDPTFWEGGPL